MIYKKHALISVNNKTNLDKICQTLSKHGINIIATNTTASYINSIGYKSISVSQITKFKEILDGKVKTLHPLIYASILFDRQNKKQLKKVIDLKVPIIDFVIVPHLKKVLYLILLPFLTVQKFAVSIFAIVHLLRPILYFSF